MKIYLFFSFFIFLNFSLYSQANLLNARVPQDIGQLNEKQVESNDEEPLEYGFIDDRAILWSKTVWEIMVFNQTYDYKYYYNFPRYGKKKAVCPSCTIRIKNKYYHNSEVIEPS